MGDDRTGADAELGAHLERLRRQQAAIVALGQSQLGYRTDLEQALRAVTEVAAGTLDVERVSVWFLDAPGSELTCADLYVQADREHSSGIVLHAEEYPRYFAALGSGRALDAHDARTDPRTSEFRAGYLEPLHITSMLDAAIRSEGRIVGVVCHEHVGPVRRWAPDEVSFAGDVADQVALILAALERRRSLDELRSSELRFRALAQNAPMGICLADPAGNCLYVNDLLYQAAGLDAHTAHGEGWRRALHPDDRARVLAEQQAAMASGGGYDGTFRLVTAGGGVVWMRTRAVPLRDEAGHITGYVGTFMDITRMKEDEAERERLLQELRAALSVRDEFLSIASHELRTPLTSLQLAAQATLELLQIKPDQPLGSAEGYLRMVERQCRRLNRLVENLLDVSRIEAGHVELHVADVDLVHIAREAAAALGEEATLARATVDVAAAGPVVGRWDGARLEQVALNLVANALKYGAGAPVTIAVREDGGQGLLEVRDRGPGIPREQQDRIFERFGRAAPRPGASGLGLGLFIVRRIVEQHGGKVWVESEAGAGAAFVVRLPRDGPNPSAQHRG